jgi:hypothetical protein
MISLLTATYTKPLEREFEAWIVEGIERYGQDVGLPQQVWAVSPNFEVVWPADEALVISGKVLGLQFKQAKLAPGAVDFSRLKWSLGTPPQQYANVQNSPEVYYCLPTFINRKFKREALQHCIFWRPPAGVADTQAWCDNPKAPTAHNSLANDPSAMRWGRLIEQVQACVVGRRVNSQEEVDAYLAEVADSARRNETIEDSDEIETDSSLVMYVLYTPL